MILKFLKLLLEWSPVLLEGIRRWDADRNAKLVVEESERAVEREIAQRGYEAGKAELVRLKAEDLLLKRAIAEMEGFH